MVQANTVVQVDDGGDISSQLIRPDRCWPVSPHSRGVPLAAVRQAAPITPVRGIFLIFVADCIVGDDDFLGRSAWLSRRTLPLGSLPRRTHHDCRLLSADVIRETE